MLLTVYEACYSCSAVLSYFSSVSCSQMGTQVFGSRSHGRDAGVGIGDISGEHSIQGELARLQRADGRVTHIQRWAGSGPGQAGTHLGS